MSARRLGKCHGKRPCALPALALPPVPAEDAVGTAQLRALPCGSRHCCEQPGPAEGSGALLASCPGLAPPSGSAAGSSWEQPPVTGLAPKFLPAGPGAGDSWVLGEVPASLPSVGPPGEKGFGSCSPEKQLSGPREHHRAPCRWWPSAHREKDFVPVDQILH